MSGMPVAHLVVGALKDLYPRAVHISELANIVGITSTSVSSSLNNRLERDDADVERVSRGVWKYVPPPVTKSGKRTPLKERLADHRADWQIGAPVAEVVPTALPKTLKVVGTTSRGLLAVDPATNESYIATRM